MLTKSMYTMPEVSKLLNVNQSTLRNWDRNGKFKPDIYTPGGHRRYSKSKLEEFLNIQSKETKETRAIIYARVSSKGQEELGNLDRQYNRLLEYVATKGYKLIEGYKEVASGMNERRAKIFKLIELILNDEVDIVVIEYRDRLARFGFYYLEHICKTKNCKIKILEDKKVGEQEELVNDLISIISSFSARIYGRRSKGRKRKKK